MATKPNGYNPLRWDCEKQGCYNKKQRPKIEQFAKCFPGKISFGDIDGIVEINGYALMLEWKSKLIEIPTGQRIMYRNITANKKIVVLCVVGDAETMTISHDKWIISGEEEAKWYASSFDDVCKKISHWANWAHKQKILKTAG